MEGRRRRLAGEAERPAQVDRSRFLGDPAFTGRKSSKLIDTFLPMAVAALVMVASVIDELLGSRRRSSWARLVAIRWAISVLEMADSAIARAIIAAEPTPDDFVDVLVVDDGQNFEQPWADALLRFLKPGGKAWWLEDPLQNLYDRPPVDLPGHRLTH